MYYLKKNGAVACTILKLKYEHSLLKRHEDRTFLAFQHG